MDKITFGEFLHQQRIKKGLTQRELAEKLYVSESAVSKWEKDKRRPDLELVSKLSEIYGITEGELIRASVDKSRAVERKQARNFRIINNVYNLFFIIGFAIALLVCFIVNLAVSRRLNWFFIVLSAINLAAIILILPQFIKKCKLIIISLSWVAGLYILLGVVCIYTRGDWLAIPVISILLAYSIIFTPILICTYLGKDIGKQLSIWNIGRKIRENCALVSVLVDGVILFVLLFVIDIYTAAKGIAGFGWSLTRGMPIVLYWLATAVATVLILVNKKLRTASKTALIITLWMLMYNAFMIGITTLLKIDQPESEFWNANLLRWGTSEQISSNVFLLINLSALILALAFTIKSFLPNKKVNK